MTDLHWALLGLGALIIGAVLAFNWWQERKFKQEAFKRFDEPKYDALMEEARAIRNEEFHIDPHAVQDDEDASDAEYVERADTSVQQANSLDDELQYEPDYEPAGESASFAETYEAKEDTIKQDALEETIVANIPEEAEVPPWEDAIEEESVKKVEALQAAVPEHPPEPEYAPEPATRPVLTIPPEVNPEIDFVGVLSLAAPASGQALREFLLSITDIDKPVYAYGLGGDQRWHLLTREQESAHFSAAICTLQLADRAGAVSTGTLSRFHLAVEELARSLGASIEWLNTESPLQQATELDQFCIEVDQMVGFHLTQGASGPFTGTKFRGLAEAGGLTLGEDGAYHYIVEDGSGNQQVLFSVVNHDKLPFTVEMLRTSVIRGLTFQLDIPRVQNYTEAYNHMVLLARQMEHGLGARLVDDKQRELGDAQIDKIRQQIKLIHDKMIAHGIVPGQAYALRLFS
ncbi:cell division protein ZipA C-terminal FtsZ-binding domain-containing protein [Methylobacillus flagellatus]|uniref:cell division protein ZipA C-terminal FtsZ-binding domain-containing protein n=1 Tax=Methylobacillus flagellatus TaxID=405 RepID=UPI002853B37E|nr:cell division protein ZipA C-terminal FtsZ-binding domain-containing protein [Methylobacillus flagellatus]MDR5171365.1 cell division protein ZipA C-terminal FtsZ-binding domain-containing protein [Methylobacillus flagellatus]